MRPGSPPACSRPRQRGFTLLELTIAMMFVVVLVSGIALTISTSLNVWTRLQEIADLNQEARAITELISRDVRGAYLGLDRTAGYFVAGEQGGDASLALVEFTTESSDVTRLALLPVAARAGDEELVQPPASDFVTVRYVLADGTAGIPAGLYRLKWAAPRADWAEQPPLESDAVSVEPISESVTGLTLRYFDGQSESWSGGWLTDDDNRRLPAAVSLELRLEDANRNLHVYQTIIPVPAR